MGYATRCLVFLKIRTDIKIELLADFQHIAFCCAAEKLRKTNSVSGIGFGG